MRTYCKENSALTFESNLRYRSMHTRFGLLERMPIRLVCSCMVCTMHQKLEYTEYETALTDKPLWSSCGKHQWLDNNQHCKSTSSYCYRKDSHCICTMPYPACLYIVHRHCPNKQGRHFDIAQEDKRKYCRPSTDLHFESIQNCTPKNSCFD